MLRELSVDETRNALQDRHSRIYENAFGVKTLFLAAKMTYWDRFPLSGLSDRTRWC